MTQYSILVSAQELYEKDFKAIVPEGFYLGFGSETCGACLDSGQIRLSGAWLNNRQD